MRYPLGAVLKVNRGLYNHYGVYVGEGRVVHFAAPYGESELDPFEADIRDVSLGEFAKGDIVFVDESYSDTFSPEEIVRRARTMLGTQKMRYNLVANNCEHFANWCRTGLAISSQSNNIIGLLPGRIRTIAGLFKEVRSSIATNEYNRILNCSRRHISYSPTGKALSRVSTSD